MLNKKNAGEAGVKELIQGLKGICARSYRFDAGGLYTENIVDGLRYYFDYPLRSRAVCVRSNRDKENVDVFFRMKEGSISGVASIAAEAKQTAFVYIDGVINPEQLAKLGGQFGIPEVEMAPAPKEPSKYTGRGGAGPSNLDFPESP